MLLDMGGQPQIVLEHEARRRVGVALLERGDDGEMVGEPEE